MLIFVTKSLPPTLFLLSQKSSQGLRKMMNRTFSYRKDKVWKFCLTDRRKSPGKSRGADRWRHVRLTESGLFSKTELEQDAKCIWNYICLLIVNLFNQSFFSHGIHFPASFNSLWGLFHFFWTNTQESHVGFGTCCWLGAGFTARWFPRPRQWPVNASVPGNCEIDSATAIIRRD